MRLNTDPAAGEPGGRIAQEAGARRPPLVVARRDVRDAARIVDGGVDVVVAGVGTPRPVAPPVGAVAATLRDPPELLHVDVEELAGALPDVADRPRGRAIAVGEAGQAVAGEDVADRRAGDAEQRCESVGSEPQLRP